MIEGAPAMTPAERAEVSEMIREARAAAGEGGSGEAILALALVRVGCRMRAFRRVDPRVLAVQPDGEGEP
jgi:hypothetical protein